MADSAATIQELKDKVRQFEEARGWGKHHTAKNLAVSIAIEAAELMEHFQWDEGYQKPDSTKEISHELADILIYCLAFAYTKNIDISEAVNEKLALAAIKYPVSIFNPERDRPEDYHAVKKQYRADKG